MNWNGRKVLVTGAGGFVGSHLAERLVELGATPFRTILSQTLAGQAVKLGNLLPTRDLNYVSDTVAGFIRVAEVEATPGQRSIWALARKLAWAIW